MNHALLLANLTSGGGLIPEHDILVIDEAHHLEDEATKHLGFQISQYWIEDQMRILTNEGGLLAQVSRLSFNHNVAETRRKALENVSRELEI